jgi:hypothetical protein
MKVLDLRCPHDHRFEGWFASEDDFQSQCERGLVDCPVCGAQGIARMPSAPRLNVSGAREPQSEVAAKPAGASPGGEVTLSASALRKRPARSITARSTSAPSAAARRRKKHARCTTKASR